MKKIIVFPIIMTLLCAIASISVLLTVREFALYIHNGKSADEETAEQAEETDIKFTLTFENQNTKYTKNAIEQPIYFGYQHMYKKDDIYFFSTTKTWDEEKLEDLAEELYDNKHAEEIKYLKMVIVNGSSSGAAAGTHSSSIEGFSIPAALYLFLPEGAELNSYYKMSTINLYGAGQDTTAADLAFVLSHEYGHHFTQYHFGLKNTIEDKKTEYYQLRAAEYENQVILDGELFEDYLDFHEWYLSEIAAEDYVALMGSANAKRVIDFYDNMDKFQVFFNLNFDRLWEISRDVVPCINGMPHENVKMKMPARVDGLIEYFYSFVDEDPPYTSPADDIGTLNLSVYKHNGNRHDFTWDQPYTDPDVVYTLIGYDLEDNIIIMVKTTRGDEKGDAGLGIYAFGSFENNWMMDDYQFYKYHGFMCEDGTEMKFRVSITFPDGKVLLSDPITIIY